MLDMHKCVDCGLLTIWANFSYGANNQLVWQERQSGIPNFVIEDAQLYGANSSKAEPYRGGSLHTFQNWPACFVNAWPLREEAEKLTVDTIQVPDALHIYGYVSYAGPQAVHHELMATDLAERFRRVINQNRECPDFFQWSPGSTPKEHVAMRSIQQIREWQARREEADREWQIRREEADRAARRTDLRWEVGIVAAVAIIAALLGGWAQAAFQKDPVVNNYLVMPNGQVITGPSAPDTLSVPTPVASP